MNKGEGRNRKAGVKTLTIQLTEAQYEWLTRYCEKHGYTIEELFRFLILPQWITAAEREEHEVWRRRRLDEVLAALDSAAASRKASVGELIFSLFKTAAAAEGRKANERDKRQQRK